MTECEEVFLKLYYKAANSGQPTDWLDTCLAAKRMYNEKRHPEDEEKEREIQYPPSGLVHQCL